MDQGGVVILIKGFMLDTRQVVGETDQLRNLIDLSRNVLERKKQLTNKEYWSIHTHTYRSLRTPLYR